MKVGHENHLINVYSRVAPDDGNRAPDPRKSRSKRETDSPAVDFIPDVPLQKAFGNTEIPIRNAPRALIEINDAMNDIVGRGNVRQYDSFRSFLNSPVGKEGKLLSRRIRNALEEACRIVGNAQRRLADPGEKNKIIEYLSAALATDNQTALEEAYTRLRNTAFQSLQRLKNFKSSNWNAVMLFERRDKSRPLPHGGRNAPLMVASPKDPGRIAMNLEALENDLPGLLNQQSSSGYNRALVDEIMSQLTRLDGNTRNFISVTRQQTGDGLCLGSAQTALDDFRAHWKFPTARFFGDPVFRADEMTSNTDSATVYLRDIGLQRSYDESVADNALNRDEARASLDEFSRAAQQLYASFPDPGKVARTIARSKLRERTGQDLDPDKVYLHQFERSQTRGNPRAYTGYEHDGKPKHSETLTQAYMDNFKIFRTRKTESFWHVISNAAGKQVADGTYPSHLDNPDLKAPFFSSPDVLSGLYTANAEAGKFGAENEVEYLPSDLRDDIADANVMGQIETSQDEFWRENRATWRSLAKGQFIEEARRALLNGTLSQQAYETAINGGAPNIVMYDPVTMDELAESAAPHPDVKVNFLGVRLPAYQSANPVAHYRLTLNPHDFVCKTNIICMTGRDGHEVLYIPGDEQPFREFANREALGEWLVEQAKDDNARAAFLEHFSLKDHREAIASSLKYLAQGTARQDLRPSIEKMDLGAQSGISDVFSMLTQLTEERAAKDADALIQSNGEVRLQVARDVLQAVNVATMPILPMLGPVGIALDLGLAGAQVGLDMGVASTADTPDERNAALSDAGLGLLFLGFNAGLAAGFSGSSIRGRLPAVRSSHQAFLKTGLSFLEEQRGFRRPSTGTGRSFGENLHFPWIDEAAGTTEAALRRQLFADGPSAARLMEFYGNPQELCYDAMVETFSALGHQGERPKAIGMLMYKNPWDEAPANHFATLIRKDDVDWVVDPTIRQFDASLPESATIQPLGQWESFFKHRAGSHDGIIVLDTFDNPLDARKAASDIYNVAGKYYQTRMIATDGVNILKYNEKFENSIVMELQKKENILRAMGNDPRMAEDIKSDLENLRMLKNRLGLLSAREIEPSATVRGKLKNRFLKDAIDEADIGALRALADDKGVVTTVSGKKYIKIGQNAFVNFSYDDADGHRGAISGAMGRNKTHVCFDDDAKKWVRG